MSNVLKNHMFERLDKTLCKSLVPVSKLTIEFDPSVPEHRRAYIMLAAGKQHETLRFTLPEQFPTVLDMMRIKLADHFVKTELA